ncbi:MAG: SUMF1/EgtB/PvdO family nonheme iron enzyme [Halopseudomonas sp.]
MNLSRFLAVLLLIMIGSNAIAEPSWRDSVTGMEFASIPYGCYQMGNPSALTPAINHRLRQLGYEGPRFADEAPVHQVCIDPFWIGRYEVTAKQWEALMDNPAPFGTGNMPASGISWRQAIAFVEKLNGLSEQSYYRLPTEAEWEYACRGGEATEPRYQNNPDRTAEAWYSNHDHSPLPNPVGELLANPWGLYDMLGNVWEWTADSYSSAAYQQHAYKNPLYDNASPQHVMRGASHRSEYRHVRCSSRGNYDSSESLPQLGFRLVREVRQ